MLRLASEGKMVDALAIFGVLMVEVERESIPAAEAASAMMPFVVTVAVKVRRTVGVA